MADDIELLDPLASFLGALAPSGRFHYSYGDAVKLCGHSCPTVAGAYLMTCRALRELYGEQLPVRGEIEVTVGGVADNGTSGPVAQVIGLVTGAATDVGFGGIRGRWRRRGLLTFDKALKGRTRFRRIDTGAAVEVSYDPSVIRGAPELTRLFSAAIDGQAQPDEQRQMSALWLARVDAILCDNGHRTVSVVRCPTETT
jgi:hypothetical protein